MRAIAIVRPSPVHKPAFLIRFMAWAALAPEAGRADAASALARACLYSELTTAKRDELTTAMAGLLDDPAPAVRRALSEALASAREAPRAIVVALANDEAHVAEPLLRRSPVLSDAELADCATTGDAAVQCAIAARSGLGPLAATALAEEGGREPVLALIGNLGAALPARALRRIHARFGEAPEVRSALLARTDLPAILRAEIVMAEAASRSGDARGPGNERVRRAIRVERDASLVDIAAECGRSELPGIARFLRARGALTLALLLRSVLSGETDLLAAALSELTGTRLAHALALTKACKGEAFAALASRAGLPRHAVTALRAALSALETEEEGGGDGLRSRLVRPAVAACETRRDPALAPVIALLWRFAAEAARRDAREAARPALAERLRLFAPANDCGPRLLTADILRASNGGSNRAAAA